MTAYEMRISVWSSDVCSSDLDHLWVVAPQLLAQPVGQPHPLVASLLGDARPLPQLDHRRIERIERAQALRIGAQGAGQHLGVPTVILGAGRREAVAEAVELLGIDGVQAQAPRHQAFTHRSKRWPARPRYFLRPPPRSPEDPPPHAPP